VKLRREKDSRVVPISEVVPVVRKRLFELEAELAGTDWGR
jgi:hypothetical protein